MAYREETKEKPTNKENWALRANSATLHGFAIVLPMFPNLSSTQSFALTHGNAMDKNGW